jgi:molybdopterin/thiamine biosynthesis adenylyltransferase
MDGGDRQSVRATPVNSLAFASADYDALAEAMLRDSRETCAALFVRKVRDAPRWIASGFELAPDEAYLERTATRSALRPTFLLDVANRARSQGLGLCFAHTHPFDDRVPAFSPIDDAGEQPVANYLNARVPNGPHLALVLSPGGAQARILGPGAPVAPIAVGETVRFLAGCDGDPEARFDRQIRAFGHSGQAALQAMKVGVVGVGGTGSLTAQQLGYLGVRRFLIIDPDTIEDTNLNRVVGARPADVGRLKVRVAKRHLKSILPDASVEAVNGDVVDATTARKLLGCDLIFICTDSHASRAVVGQLAYQYLIPVIDMGVSISIRGGKVAFVTGRVQMLAPGLPCLACIEALDPEQVRRELLRPSQRAADPYIVGHHEPQPAVISLNATVSALSVTMALGAVTPAPIEARFQIYDGINGTVRNMSRTPEANCFVCSRKGSLLKGDAWPLPVRGRG